MSNSRGASKMLYKYLVPDRIDVLQDCMVRYTQPEAFNDPFEVKPYITKLTAKEHEAFSQFEELISKALHEYYDLQPIQVQDRIPFPVFYKKFREELGRALKETFYQMEDGVTPIIRRMWPDKFSDMLGIFSLTEKPDNLLMWAHYAASHEGFVVGFDSSHPYFHDTVGHEDELRHLCKVEYRENRPMSAMTELSGIDVFLVKSTQWSYEQEWRIIRPLQDNNKIVQNQPYPIYLFQFPATAIKEVILGCKMTENKKQDIIAILSSGSFQHVQVWQAEPDETEFKLKLLSLTR